MSTYAYENRRRAHELRAAGKSLRNIAAELGVAVSKVQRYLREPPRDAGCTPLTTPSDLRKCDQSGIGTYTEAPIWGNPTFNVFPLVTVGVEGGTPPADDDDMLSSWVEPPYSRWRQPSRCYCSLRRYRWYPKRQYMSAYVLDVDDPNNNVKPLIRCPTHNGLVRSGYVGRVENGSNGEVFRNLFLDPRHAAAAVEYARRKEIPLIKSRYQVTIGAVYLTTSASSITYRQKSKDRGYEQCDGTGLVLPILDAALQGIDTMITTRGAHGWEPPPTPPPDDEADDESEGEEAEAEPYDEVFTYAFLDITDVQETLFGEARCPANDAEWERFKSALNDRKQRNERG